MTQQSNFRAYLRCWPCRFFWGTTYLGIRMSLEAFPPILLISLRFLLSGMLMMIGARISGASFPKGRELWLTALYGVIILGGGNGSLVWAEQTVPSGLAALLLVTSPFWMVGLNAAFSRERMHLPTLGGILVGCVGVIMLLAPQGLSTSFSASLVNGFVVLQLGCFLWCLGASAAKTAANQGSSDCQRRRSAVVYGTCVHHSGTVNERTSYPLEYAQHVGAWLPGDFRIDCRIQRVSLCAGESTCRNRQHLQLCESGGGDAVGMAVLSRAVRAAGDHGYAYHFRGSRNREVDRSREGYSFAGPLRPDAPPTAGSSVKHHEKDKQHSETAA